MEGISFDDLRAGVDDGYRNDPSANALAKELDRKKASRTLQIPTNDDAVRARLRELGEPITLFGERKEDRRDRLRNIVSQLGVSGMIEAEESESEEEEEEEEFYTEGSSQLLDTRRDIARTSLRRAQKRVARQRLEAELPLGAILDLRKLVYNELKTYTTFSSQVGDDRPLSIVRFSPDSSLLATGSWTGLAKLWDVPSCRCRAILKGHGTERIGGIAWHPQATLSQPVTGVNLATGGADGTVALWDLQHSTDETGKPAINSSPLRVLNGHEHRVCRVAFHPDGRLLGSASFDETWRLWDVEKGSCLLEQEGHSKEVYAIAFQDDGALVCTGGLDAIGRVWDLRTGRTIMVLDGHVQDILAADFAPNGHQIATGSNDDTIRIWDLRQARGASYTIAAHKKSVTDVRFFRPATPNMPFPRTVFNEGDRPAVNGQGANHGTAKTEDGMEEDEKPDSAVETKIEPPLAGIYFASSGHDGQVKLWSADDWQLIRSISAGDDSKVTSVDISQNGKYVASAEWSRTFRLIAAESMV